MTEDDTSNKPQQAPEHRNKVLTMLDPIGEQLIKIDKVDTDLITS